MLRNFRNTMATAHAALLGRKRTAAGSKPGRVAGLKFEPLEPRTLLDGVPAGADNLQITELNYHPHGPTPEELAVNPAFVNDDFEFIELQNVGTERIDLSGVQFVPTTVDDNDVQFGFDGGSVLSLDAGQFVIVVRNPQAFQARYGTVANVAGAYVGELENNGDNLQLLDASSGVIFSFKYEDSGAGGWPDRADGAGASLELKDPTDLEDGDSWRSSGEFAGSPGYAGAGRQESIVVINEALAHSDLPLTDTIELYNTTTGIVDIGGWYLSDYGPGGGTYRKYQIPAGTTIAPGGYISFDEYDFNPDNIEGTGVPGPNDFALSSAHGEDVWLLQGDGTRPTYFIDHVSFGASLNGEPFGRWPGPEDGLYPMRWLTRDAPNSDSGPRVGPIVISEIMYNSPDSDALYEFVELYNPTDLDVYLHEPDPADPLDFNYPGWEIRSGIDFSFDTPGFTIPARSTVVVVPFDPLDPLTGADDLAAFRTQYGLGATEVTIVGPYAGSLSDGGETARLTDWDEPPHDEPDYFPRTLEDEVAFDDAWYPSTDGNGDSLHRKLASLLLWGDDPASWQAGSPTPGTVTLGNFAPYAGDDWRQTPEDHEIVIDVLENDIDLDNPIQPSWVQVVTDPDHGVATPNPATGQITYTPGADFFGSDSFQYQIQQPGGQSSNVATVHVLVEPLNDPPVGHAATVDTNEDQDASGDLSGYEGADNEVNDQTLTFALVDGAGPSHGEIIAFNVETGEFTYRPVPDYHGPDSFRFTVTDHDQTGTALLTSSPATVSITVAPANDEPVAGDDTGTTGEDSAVVIAVLGNDTDIDGDGLSIAAIDDTGLQGTAADNGNGTLSYDPDGAFDHLAVGETAVETFGYTVSDGHDGTDLATVTVTITGVNDQPKAGDDTAGTSEDNPVEIAVTSLLANDSDPDTSDVLTVTSVSNSATVGTAVLVGNTVKYDPGDAFAWLAVGELRTDTFTYEISDGHGGTGTAAVAVTITGTNDLPTANDDVQSTSENAPLEIAAATLLANDTDPDGNDVLTLTGVDDFGTTGTVVLDGTMVRYEPGTAFDALAVGQSATDTFGYTIGDGHGGTATATVTITITGANDSPTAAGDLAIADENTPVNIPAAALLANDSDPDDGDTLTVTAVNATATIGDVSLSANTVTYNPGGAFHWLAGGESTTDTFHYTIGDGHGGTATAAVTVTIHGVNDAPAAVDDTATTNQDTPIDLSAADLLANDSDPDTSDVLTVASVNDSATIGTATLLDTTVTYDPAGQFDWLALGESAPDTFTYTISDGRDGTDTATVVVTITGINDPPVANDESAQVHGGVVRVNVLANDSDPEDDPLSIVIVESINGVVVVDDGGTPDDPSDDTVDFTVSAGFVDTGSFRYRVNDGQLDSNEATVTITRDQVNNRPVARNDVAGTPEDVTVHVDVLANDTDLENDPLTISILSSTFGVATVDDARTPDDPSDDTVAFTPTADFEGTAEFTYRVSDGSLDSNEAAVTINVAAVNDPPTAGDDSAETDEDLVIYIDVLANDTDPENDPLTISILSSTFGVATVDDAGTPGDPSDDTVTFTPTADFHGAAEFTYCVSDGSLDSNEATVTIAVAAANDVPDATDDSYEADENGVLAVTDLGVLGNDQDIDGDVLTAVPVAGPTHGTLDLAADGSFTYTPSADFIGTDTFTYRAHDGQQSSNEAMVTITVIGSYGTVDFLRREGLDSSVGDIWLYFAARRDGVLTAELAAEQFGEDTLITLYRDDGGSLQQVASGPSRLDVPGAGGQQYAVQITALVAETDLALANLVQISPDASEATVFGTAGDDTFEATAGPLNEMIINGVAYTSPSGGKVRFLGNGGHDTADLTGTAADDAATVHPTSARVTGPGYEVELIDVVEMTLRGGGGHDAAGVYDSAGDDLFVGTPVYAGLQGEGFYHRLRHFAEVHVEATAGGTDEAKFYDSTGNDQFVATPVYSAISGEGFQVDGRYFESVCAYATAGGTDEAKFYDSPGNDDYIATPVYGAMYNEHFHGQSNATFYNRARFFEGVHAYATAGGIDVARFYDSTGNDEFVATPVYAALYNPAFQGRYHQGFYNRAKYFEGAHAYSTAGERDTDIARLYDSVGDDIFYGDPVHGALYSQSYNGQYNATYYNRAKFFQGVHAYATAGGSDTAGLHGSDSNDTFYADPQESSLYRSGEFYNRAKYFEAVYAEAHDGGDDRAYLHDSPSADLLQADANWARLSNAALDFLYQAMGFDYVRATASGPGNTKVLPEPVTLPFVLDLEGPW
ncbi:MAG: tandem-95 repeat protein [Pirellulales bacterium]|nr:tandem-95 repeat protein [Pirellulales bacterium]